MQRTLPSGLLALSAVLLVAACGDSGGSASSGADELCSSISSLNGSVGALRDVDVPANGVSALADAVDQVRTDLSTVVSEAEDRFAPHADQLEADGQALQDAVGAAVAGPSAATLSSVTVAVGALVSDMEGLTDDLGSAC